MSTVAQGRFELRIRDNQIDYTLTYSGLEGAVSQAHIHFAQPGVNGGITAWLCEATATSPQPSFTTQCPKSGDGDGDDPPGERAEHAARTNAGAAARESPRASSRSS